MMLALVTATHNSMPTIAACLESTEFMPDRAKTILVDGGSTDGTVQFLDHYAQNHNNTEILKQDCTVL